jgi:putative membrane protein
MTTPPDRDPNDLPTIRGSVPPLRAWIRTFLIGLCMGSADGVPGVSGGTIALIAGVYERLIAAITAVTPGRILRFFRALAPVDGGVDPRGAFAELIELDIWFLIALVTGVGTAVVIVTRIVHVASQETPALLFGFFFGLIAASAVVLLRSLTVASPFQMGAGVVGFVLAFYVSGVSTSAADGGGLALVFFAGMIGVSAMILPGISGSLLLIILGQYTRMSTALSEFVDALIALATGGTVEDVTTTAVPVVTFILGGLVGLFTIARVVRRALDYNRRATLAFLVALVVGALRAPVVEVRGSVGFSTDVLVAFVAAAAVGAAVLLALDWYAVDLDLDKI